MPLSCGARAGVRVHGTGPRGRGPCAWAVGSNASIHTRERRSAGWADLPVRFGCLNRRRWMQAQGRELPRFLRERFLDSSGRWNRYYFYTNFEIGSLGFFRHARTSTKRNRTAYPAHCAHRAAAMRCGSMALVGQFGQCCDGPRPSSAWRLADRAATKSTSVPSMTWEASSTTGGAMRQFTCWVWRFFCWRSKLTDSPILRTHIRYT